MTHNHNWRKAAAWDGEDPPNGFDRTLPPSDPRARSGVPASGYVVRDNRRRVVLSPEGDSVDAKTPPGPMFGDVPVSGVVARPAAQSLRVQIPVARITRDDDLLPHDLWLDPPMARTREPDPTIEVTPDFASEYVPPQPLPEAAQHKTFELKPVRLAPEIHPRTAPTVLNARAVQRRHDKQQKDAREFEALLAQSERRRRGPLMAVAFTAVVLVGFVLGTELVHAPGATAEVGAPVAEVPASPVGAAEVQAAQAPAPPTEGQRVALAASKPAPTAVNAPAARAEKQSKRSPASSTAVAKPPPAPTDQSGAAREPAYEQTSADKPVPVDVQAPEPASRPVREVWLK